MRLTVLGCSPASTNPGGASSSYLVETATTRLVVDCGSGSFGNLLTHAAPDEVDAVIISHMHGDHILDLLPFRYALAFAATEGGGGAPTARRPALYLPPEGHAKALMVSHVQEGGDDFFAGFFRLAEYDPQQPLVIGDLTVTFVPVKHIPHTYALRLTEGSRTLAYSADTGLCPTIYDAARGADIFLCECANSAGSDFLYHLSPAQAGEIAHRAGVHRLVLTHRWYRLGLDTAADEARAHYGGPIDLAFEGATWDV
ncbi:MAG: MBL fold metallo-hydrolase [Chloroflexota bacterium]